MKNYFWSPELCNTYQKTNYITVTLARKICDQQLQNKRQFIQKNSISIFLKINNIQILLEKYIFNDNKNNENKNLITFFFVKNEIGRSSLNNFNADNANKIYENEKKINVILVFDHEYYNKAFSMQPLQPPNYENLIPEESHSMNYMNNSANNELIQGIIVYIIKFY